MKIIFARHGESQANLQRVFSNRDLPHPLTPLGEDQARQLANRLQAEPIIQITSSPILRARQTTQIVAHSLGLTASIHAALREYDVGCLEGSSDPHGWALYDEILRDWIHNQNWERGFEGGESFNDMRQRFLPFIHDLVTRYRETDGAVLLITHGGLLRCMLPVLVANIDFSFALEHSIANTALIQVEPRSGRLLCTEWCGLTGQDLPVTPPPE